VLASGGRFHQKFWKIDGRCLNADYPQLPPEINLGTLLCGAEVSMMPKEGKPQSIAVDSGEEGYDAEIPIGSFFASGSTSGHLYLWCGRDFVSVTRAHERAITTMHNSNLALITGSKDGFIKLWHDGLAGLYLRVSEKSNLQRYLSNTTSMSYRARTY